MDTKEIGCMIRSVRKKSGLTQKKLALLAEIGKTAVFDVEKGKLTVRFDTLLKILNVLNIKLELKSPLKGSFE